MAATVGFIGLGTMGGPMARSLARAGFPVALASGTAAKARALAEELTAAGKEARAFDRFDDVGREAEIVVSCLPDAPEVEAVHLGPTGTSRGAGKSSIVIDCSTIAAEAARSIAGRLAERGVAFLDAPVSGGQKGAVEGTLTFFIGGDAAVVERARPVFQAMGKRLTHLGPSGSGQLGKAANQILVAGNLIAVSEAIFFAARAGLPLSDLHAALGARGARQEDARQGLQTRLRDQAPAEGPRDRPEDSAAERRAPSRHRPGSPAPVRPRSRRPGR